ncbi:MAG TPA: SDR family oxidoreductase [Candidatus Binataceae bacterium]|nr:SDR family oxidoreductase [Candidatus Binataceae bacterium]
MPCLSCSQFGSPNGGPHFKIDFPVRAIDSHGAALEKLLPLEQALPGIGTTDKVAHAVRFLTSDDSSFVNGHDLVIDGAVTAGNPARVMNEQISIFVKTLQPLASR